MDTESRAVKAIRASLRATRHASKPSIDPVIDPVLNRLKSEEARAEAEELVTPPAGFDEAVVRQWRPSAPTPS